MKKRQVFQLKWIVLFILVWEFFARLGIMNNYILPPFSQVFFNTLNEIIYGELMIKTYNSLIVVIMSFLFSLLLSLFLSAMCVVSNSLYDCIVTICNIFSTIPGVAILPIIMMIAGINSEAMNLLIIHSTLWPLIINIVCGFGEVPLIYKEYAINIELSPREFVTEILFMASLPNIIKGIRIAWGRAWRALISAEMIFGVIGVNGGIGYYIFQNRAYANMTNVMSGVLVIVFIGILMDFVLFRKLEDMTIKNWGLINE